MGMGWGNLCAHFFYYFPIILSCSLLLKGFLGTVVAALPKTQIAIHQRPYGIWSKQR
jgi:hypothetical protein